MMKSRLCWSTRAVKQALPEHPQGRRDLGNISNPAVVSDMAALLLPALGLDHPVESEKTAVDQPALPSNLTMGNRVLLDAPDY